MTRALTLLQDFYKTTISLQTGAGAGKIYVGVLPTRSAGYLVISAANSVLREIIYYDSTGTDGTGPYVNVAAVGDRGLGGTTARIHNAQESIRMNLTSLHWEDMVASFAGKFDLSNVDTDGTLAANSDTKVPSQKAVKTYAMPASYLDTSTTLGTSDVKVPSQNAVKQYADGLAIAGAPNASTTTKGIVEESTQAQIESETGTGETGARLFMNPSTWFSAFKNKFTVIETTSLPYSLTTTAGQRVIVFAKAATGTFSTGGETDFTLSYNGVIKDTIKLRAAGASERVGFSLMYTEIPGAATANITLSGGTDQKLIIIKF